MPKSVEVCEGLEIVNVDGHQLETLKRTSNTIDTGASYILEGLEMFAEDLEDKYEEEPSVPYDKLYFALKQVITSALENQSVRDAIMTGVITETKDGLPVRKQPKKVVPVLQPVQPQVVRVKNLYNKSAVANYAKTHTADEIVEHFNFPTKRAAWQYLNKYGIKFVNTNTNTSFDLNKLKLFANKMTLSELARSLSASRQCIYKYCKQNHIEYKKRGM